MSTETNTHVFRQFVEAAFHRGDLDAFDTLFWPDALIHDPGVENPSVAAMRRGIVGLRAAVPDFRITIDDEIAQDDRVAVRYHAQGTLHGTLFGVVGTGQRIGYTGMVMLRVRDGRIAEYRVQPDLLGLMRQLGIPAAGPEGAPRPG